MKYNHSLRSIFAMAALAAAALIAAAPVNGQVLLNLQLNGGGAPGYTGAAAIGSSGDIWNNIALPAIDVFTPSTGYVFSDGFSATGISISGTNYNFAGSVTGITGNTLLEYYIGEHGNASNSILTISGLNPGDLYNVYVYSSSDHQGTGGSFSLNGSPTLTTTGLGGIPRLPNFTEGVDYVKFISASVNGSGNLVLTQFNPGGASGYTVLNGLQLESVPEPSVNMMLLGAGIGAFVITRLVRRQRSLSQA